MPRPERGIAILALAVSAGFGCPADAQSSPPDRGAFYHPGSIAQTPPLRVEVLDGRRFRDVETGAVYRLYGIDTCAPGQTAALGRQPWPCGAVATVWLVTATLDRWVSCTTVREETGERLARCASAAHADLAADMVGDGIAVTTPASERDPAIRTYAAAERDARKARRGLWASTFQMPWDFRAGAARSVAAGLGQEPTR